MTNYDMFERAPASNQMFDWQPTRQAGLDRLHSFVPFAGAAYTRGRNTDFGPNDRSNVSALSPFLARRMITEAEVVRAAMAAHGFRGAEKFIQEVYWRTYWKGWLEMRPQVLMQFNAERLHLKTRLETDTKLNARLQKAIGGRTGIECFDAWVGELVTHGWLHNHARMWFASIWIFTLGLPWQLGADFFYKHLLDRDVASNTLSWRWVAGLHTKGKHYLARASNIETHTGGRFNPRGQLNETALPLQESYQAPGPAGLPLSEFVTAERVGLLIGQDDLDPASLKIGAKVVGAAIFALPPLEGESEVVTAFAKSALEDAQIRTREHFDVETAWCDDGEAVADWAEGLGVTQVAMAYAPTGLMAWELGKVRALLARRGIALVMIRREWDSATWPLATGGFFKLKEKLPNLVERFAAR